MQAFRLKNFPEQELKDEGQKTNRQKTNNKLLGEKF
jgi:hypothetical protein